MGSPALVLLAPAIALWLAAQAWRRRRLRRAVRELPTRQRRLLGPEPEFLPPETDAAALAPEMAGYLRQRRRAGWLRAALRALAGLWLLFALWVLASGSGQGGL
jgi:hypothetical protein